MEKSKSKAKSKRGGARAGAGRKPNLLPVVNVATATSDVATKVLARVGEEDRWVELIDATAPSKIETYVTVRSDDGVVPLTAKESAQLLTVHFNALRYMKDCRDGRPRQSVEHSGGMALSHTFQNLSDADLDNEIGKLQHITEASEAALGPVARGEEPAAG